MAIRTILSENRISTWVAAGALLGTALAAGPVAGQPAPGGGPGKSGPAQGGKGMGSQQQKELQDAQKKVRDLSQQIGDIQKKAMEANPELQKQREDLRSLLKEKMEAKGHTPDQNIDRMKEIRKQLSESKDLPKSERQKLMQEFQNTARTFRQAQKEAMQDPEVQKARQAFQDDLMAAMKKEDPKVEQLIQDLRQARQEFQSLLKQRFSGGGPGKGQGPQRGAPGAGSP